MVHLRLTQDMQSHHQTDLRPEQLQQGLLIGPHRQKDPGRNETLEEMTAWLTSFEGNDLYGTA